MCVCYVYAPMCVHDCMYVFVCVCDNLCVWMVREYARVNTRVCACADVGTYVCARLGEYVRVYVCVYVCVRSCMWAFAHVCVCACVCVCGRVHVRARARAPCDESCVKACVRVLDLYLFDLSLIFLFPFSTNNCDIQRRYEFASIYRNALNVIYSFNLISHLNSQCYLC